MAKLEQKRKPIFKRHIFAFIDYLNAKKAINNRYNTNSKANFKVKKINYNVNELAKQLHPANQQCQITKITKENKDVITYTFKRIDGKMAYFRPGQWIALKQKINDVMIVRPYTLSSSPKLALKDNQYEVTIKKQPNGYFSNYIAKNWKVGDVVNLSDPKGDFVWSSVYLSNNIIGLARGAGITPFLSFAKAIVDGTIDVNLTILYESNNRSELIQKQILDDLSIKSNGKVKVIYLFSNLKKNNAITPELIKENYKDNTYLYICGSKFFNDRMDEVIKKLKIRSIFVKTERNNQLFDPSYYKDYKFKPKAKFCKMTFIYYGEKHEIKAEWNETILNTLLKNKFFINNGCLNGSCGSCRVELVKGKVFVPKNKTLVRAVDKQHNVIYSCSSYPISDIVIKYN